MKGPKRIAVIILAGLFVYLSLYTWNLRTGHLDALSSYTGLDVSGAILRPGIWVTDQIGDFWMRYIYLVGLKQENDDLKGQAAELRRENMLLHSQARSAERLEDLLKFTPPDQWEYFGARVIAHRMGPAGALDTIAVDKGSSADVEDDMPAVSLKGVVGRVLRTGAATSTILLLTDPNSRIAVIGAEHRSPAMLAGQGYGKQLILRYINQNAPIEPNELLLSSGLSGIFPKGLPVARVTRIQRSDISLFLTVMAEPLVDMAGLEEILLLKRTPGKLPDETPVSEEGADGAADQ
ncbi:rod shape-determining protein MreC [uncultured Pseudodesulfovibrio sp.]|uniref:rod shape-determining protein MreC n=1 Tax=uncultured Pseudodesulfovibrio sp. TaxID=2035858 RepID=UPI0029C78C87|nr:rod shape-determining protein MreC [uncultured Pseudodesulfovibrio sp.]